MLFKWRQAIISKDGPEKPTTRHILLTLSLHMDQDGNKCFPSISTLAAETGLSRRAICLHLDLAERDGWIKKEICGFSGQDWKRHRYLPLIPKKVVTESNHVNEKGGYLIPFFGLFNPYYFFKRIKIIVFSWVQAAPTQLL